jgi:diguanylate cyclase (GGDEF)-like protein
MAGSEIGGRWRFAASRGVYAAAGLAMVAFVVAIALSVDLASREADRVVLERELVMVELEIDRQIEAAAHRQAEFTHWDDAVWTIVKKKNPKPQDLDADELEWIFDDLGFTFLVVVDRNDRVKFAAHRNLSFAGQLAQRLAAGHGGLISLARNLYLERRVQVGSGYLATAEERGRVPGIHAGEISMFAGEPAIVVAQAIVPENEEYSLAESEIDIALAVFPIGRQALVELGERLRLIRPQIVLAAESPPHPPSKIGLPRISDAPQLALIWQPEAPRPAILGTTVPFAGVISVTICLMLAFIVRRHGRAVASLAESEAKNRYMASHDQLTGLLNRAAFDAALARLTGQPGAPGMALLCIDLDRFKAVNDTHGHPAGDAVLCEVAKRISGAIDERGMVARLGGDEFVAVLPDWRDRDEAMWLADRLVQSICRPIFWNGNLLEVGASIGVACWPQDGLTVRELIAAADGGLYSAKRAGRGRAVAAKAPPQLRQSA